MTGGYDDGYRACSCFWGREPGSMVRRLVQLIGDVRGMHVLDAGCGEGKNAAFLAGLGASVDAIDVSELAIANGRRTWGSLDNVTWRVADVMTCALPAEQYDVVVAYGVLHCMRERSSVLDAIRVLQRTTRRSGYHVICSFNDRRQDLSAHPGFRPALVPHREYVDAYDTWRVVEQSDTDLVEQHPHNNIQHVHSMTRLLARKESG